jgi:hypothetical protein
VTETKYKFGDVNCVVSSIAAITGQSPNQVMAGIALAAEDGELAFDADGFAARRVYTRYLVQMGWRGTCVTDSEPLKSIPATALVIYDGHAFALVNGVIYDTGARPRDGRKILAVYEPLSNRHEDGPAA